MSGSYRLTCVHRTGGQCPVLHRALLQPSDKGSALYHSAGATAPLGTWLSARKSAETDRSRRPRDVTAFAFCCVIYSPWILYSSDEQVLFSCPAPYPLPFLPPNALT